MKLGVSAFAWTAKFDRSHLRLVPLVKEMGFSGFEIAMFDPTDLAVNDIRRAFETSDLECTVCAILPPASIRSAPIPRSGKLLCSTWSDALRLHRLSVPSFSAVHSTRLLAIYQSTGRRKTNGRGPLNAFQSVCDVLDSCNVTHLNRACQSV